MALSKRVWSSTPPEFAFVFPANEPYSATLGWDWTAHGDVHRPSTIKAQEVRYAGNEKSALQGERHARCLPVAVIPYIDNLCMVNSTWTEVALDHSNVWNTSYIVLFCHKFVLESCISIIDSRIHNLNDFYIWLANSLLRDFTHLAANCFQRGSYKHK